jgi:hypothetical protein
MVSGLAIVGSLCGILWPTLYRGYVLEVEDYTPWMARVTASSCC